MKDYRKVLPLARSQKQTMEIYADIVKRKDMERYLKIINQLYISQCNGSIFLLDPDIGPNEFNIYMAIRVFVPNLPEFVVVVRCEYFDPNMRPNVYIIKDKDQLWNTKSKSFSIQKLKCEPPERRMSFVKLSLDDVKADSMKNIIDGLRARFREESPVFWCKIPLLKSSQVYIKSSSVLGSGTNGVVYKGEHNRCQVAVKVPNDAAMKENFKYLKRELETQSSVDHINIVKIIGLTVSAEMEYRPAIVMELCHHQIQNVLKNFTVLNEQKLDWMVQIARAVVELHANNIIHRDLKTGNVMLEERSAKGTQYHIVKLIDFGYAREMGISSTQITAVGTPSTCSPEILSRMSNVVEDPCTVKADVYSFACVVYCILIQEECYFDFKSTKTGPNYVLDFIQLVIGGMRPKRYPCIPDMCWSLMEKCWRKNAVERPSMSEVIAEMLTWDVSKWGVTSFKAWSGYYSR